MSFMKAYKGQIIGAIIVLVMGSAIPTTIWIHNAYADDRYVQKKEVLRVQIQNIDDSLFEIEQEISFAKDQQDKAKYVARKAYYENKKEALKEILTSKDEE